MPVSDKLLKSLQVKADKALENVSSTKSVIEELLQSLDGINERDSRYKKWMREPIPAKELEEAFKGNRFKSQARKILIAEVEKAISATKEFDLPLFRKRLMTAIADPRTIEVKIIGDGKAELKINLAETAGTVKDWYNASKEVRRKEGFGKSRQGYNDVVADMWAEKIYDVDRESGRVTRTYTGGKKVDITKKYKGKYFDTIRKRVGALSSLAPWWEFLEHGTGYGGSGKGYPYPNYEGYRFVANTIIEINQRINNAIRVLDNAKKKELTKWINENDKVRKKIVTMINSLSIVGEVPARAQPFQSAALYNKSIKEARRLTRQYLETIRKMKYGRSIWDILNPSQLRQAQEALIEGVITGQPSSRMYFWISELGKSESLRFVELTRELASRFKEQGINIQALGR